MIPEARGDCAGLGLVTDVKKDLRVARAVENEVEEGGLALPGLADGGDHESLVRVGGELDHGGAGHSLQQILNVSLSLSSLSQYEDTQILTVIYFWPKKRFVTMGELCRMSV